MKCGEILENHLLKTDYYRIRFYAPEIAAKALPGQFVHVRISEDSIHILRRPFSIHDTAPDGSVTLVYKVVGAGTRELAAKKPGDVCGRCILKYTTDRATKMTARMIITIR